jgi:hypothetical protein
MTTLSESSILQLIIQIKEIFYLLNKTLHDLVKFEMKGKL